MSESPASGGVSHPLSDDDMRHMEAEVKRNLKYWGFLEALRAGRMPTNAQLDAILKSLAKRCALPPRHEATGWSADTLNVVSALRALLRTLRIVVREKNADELFQDTMWLIHTESLPRVRGCTHRDLAANPRQAPCDACRSLQDRGLHVIDRDLNDQVDAAALDHAVREGELAEAARHVRRLATILVTNADLRHAMQDMLDAARAMLRGNRPTPESTADPGSASGTGGTSTASSAGAAGRASTVTSPGTGGASTVTSLGAAQDAVQATPPAAAADAPYNPPVDTDNDDELHVPGAWGDPWESDSGSEDSWEDAQETTMADKMRENPKLRDFIRHFKAAVTTLQSQEGYAESMAWLIDVFAAYENEEFARRFPGERPSPHTMNLNALTATRKIFSNILTLMERFARGKSVSPIQQAIQKVVEDVLGTPELRLLWEDIDKYIHRILLQYGYVQTDECAAEGRMLFDRCEQWLNNTVYWAHWNAVVSGLSIWLGDMPSPPGLGEERPAAAGPGAHGTVASTWFHDDPLTCRLEKDWSKLVSALFLDQRGRLTVKRALWKDLGGILFPAIRGFGYLTIPRLEFVSANMELVVENVNVALANLLPTYITLESRDALKCSPFPETQQECMTGTYSRVRLRATQIQGEVRDAMIALKWKKGLKIQDAAMLDIIVARHGVSVDIELEIDTRDNSPYVVRARKVEFTIDEASVVPRQSKTGRDTLYRVLLATIGVPFLKRRMTARWAQRVRTRIALVDAELVALRDELAEANRRAERDARKGVAPPGATARIVQVLRNRMTLLKARMDEHKAMVDSHVQRLRRMSMESAGSNISAGSAGSGSSVASSASSESNPPPPEPGADPAAPFKKFRVSTRLEDAILPGITYDAARSLVYQRRRVERGATRAFEAAHAIGAAGCGNGVAATAMGLRGRAGADTPWRSPAFSL